MRSSSASTRKSRRSPSASASSRPIRGTWSRHNYPIGARVKRQGPQHDHLRRLHRTRRRHRRHGARLRHVAGPARSTIRPKSSRRATKWKPIVLDVDQGQPAHQPRHEAARDRSVDATSTRSSRSATSSPAPSPRSPPSAPSWSSKDGIDGLVHISQISEDRIDKVKDVLKPGQEVNARVIKIDSGAPHRSLDQGRQLQRRAAQEGKRQLRKPPPVHRHGRPRAGLQPRHGCRRRVAPGSGLIGLTDRFTKTGGGNSAGFFVPWRRIPSALPLSLVSEARRMKSAATVLNPPRSLLGMDC